MKRKNFTLIEILGVCALIAILGIIGFGSYTFAMNKSKESATQALLAARAGATYVSPFVGRLDDIGQDGLSLIEEIVDIFNVNAIETEIIVASVRNPIHVSQAARLGADIATVPYKVITQMSKHPLTDKGIENFLKDWEGASLKL